jgi:putative addiction module killer protein
MVVIILQLRKKINVAPLSLSLARFIGLSINIEDTRRLACVVKASIARRLDRLALGNPGDHKAVREGVSELRIDVGSGYRVYYAERGERLVILLCGGDKSTRRKDIELALEYWADWKRRRK